MNRTTTDPIDGVDRRSVLAAGAAGLSLPLSGCVDTVRSVVDPDRADQISISIATVPGDYDRESLRIARHLESNLQAVGIDATMTLRDPSDVLEMVLLEHEFDVYVGRHPADFDPDFLYDALHSTFANEAGWQNPFGTDRFDDEWVDDELLDGQGTDVSTGDHLEEQRRATGDDRADALEGLLVELAQRKPFDPICRPTECRLYRDDRFDGWEGRHLATRRGYIGLEPTDDDVDRLTALVTDSRPTANVNPLSATNRERGPIVDLLYDSLGTVVDDEGEPSVEPWLADHWETATDGDGRTTVTVTLREECPFHDHDETDETVTAKDVAFTYRFYEDTTYGRPSSPSSPAPRYRGQTSAVDEIEVEDDYRLRIAIDGNVAVAERALTVPILPRHVWVDELDDRHEDADDFSPEQGRWDLVTSSSIEPVGSGPYRFGSQSERDHLTLERFDDHFTLRDGEDDDHLLEPGVEELRFSVDPGSETSISRVENGDADLTSSMLDARSIPPRDVIDDMDGVEASERSSRTFYHVGFNTRENPCGNVDFRRIVARLIDKAWIVDEIFDGHAEPLATPVTEEWRPDVLEWDGEDPTTPFFGTEGDLDDDDLERARRAFEATHYRVDEGRVLY